MILYHFTEMKNVEAIKRDGIEASARVDDDMAGGASIVWLCDTPTLEATDAEVEIFRQLPVRDLIVSKRWLMSHHDQPMARLTLRLPSHDRKLKQYGTWLRANHHRFEGLPDPDADSLYLKRAMNSWWVYFDDIPPSKITECVVEEAIPVRTAGETARAA